MDLQLSRSFADQLFRLARLHLAVGSPIPTPGVPGGLCRQCHSILLPGVTCRVRVRHR
ncbi:unnamed protein product, partial [Phaeothamnion confervicola]